MRVSALDPRRLHGDDRSAERAAHALAPALHHGPLDTTQRLGLAEIAERCPIQRTLRHEVIVEQRLAPGD